MAVVIGDQTRYKRAEVCRMVGSNRKPFFRRLRDGVFCGAEHRDWRGGGYSRATSPTLPKRGLIASSL
jgi:hypothetical protein